MYNNINLTTNFDSTINTIQSDCKLISIGEKRERVTKLYLKGYVYREIARIVHMSIRDISTICFHQVEDSTVLEILKKRSTIYKKGADKQNRQ